MVGIGEEDPWLVASSSQINGYNGRGRLLAWKSIRQSSTCRGVLAEIETDKAIMDLEAFAPGVLRKILVQDGATVTSGTLIA